MKTLWIIPLALLLAFSCFSQDKSYLPYIRFHSDFEKQSWSKDKVVFIDLYASIDSTVTQKEFEDFKEKLNDFYADNPFSNKPGKKRAIEVEKLYNAIHATFLERYRLNVDFTDLFRKKEYNCVTASLLYAEILNHYHIPYIILNEPNHVLLVAYPDEEYLVLETTSPMFKSFQIPKKLREATVKKLLANKSISQKEIDTLGMNQVYEINWMHQERVTESELIGFEYSNKVHFTLEDNQDYLAAVQYALRALYLIPENKEVNQVFAEVANYSLQQTSGLDSSSLHLKLITLDEVVFNHLNSKELAKGMVGLWIIQKFRTVYKDDKFFQDRFMPAYISSDFEFIGDDEDYYEEEYEDEYEEEDLEELGEEEEDEEDFDRKEEQLQQLIKQDLPRFEKMINDFVQNSNWNLELNKILCEGIIEIFTEEDYELALVYIEKLKKIDPNSKVVKRNLVRILDLEFSDRLKENPSKYAEIIQEFKQKATELSLAKEYINRFEIEVFNEFQSLSKEFYLSKKVKDGNTYFDICKQVYTSIKDNVTSDQREDMEYDLGYLYIYKSEKHAKAEKIKILTEGLRLLPKHKALKATCKNNSIY